MLGVYWRNGSLCKRILCFDYGIDWCWNVIVNFLFLLVKIYIRNWNSDCIFVYLNDLCVFRGMSGYGRMKWRVLLKSVRIYWMGGKIR